MMMPTVCVTAHSGMNANLNYLVYSGCLKNANAKIKQLLIWTLTGIKCYHSQCIELNKICQLLFVTGIRFTWLIVINKTLYFGKDRLRLRRDFLKEILHYILVCGPTNITYIITLQLHIYSNSHLYILGNHNFMFKTLLYTYFLIFRTHT